MPLALLGIVTALYFARYPHRLLFLVSLSFTTITAGPSILILNIYRAWAGLFPAAWEQAGFWRGPAVFIGIQVLGILLSGGNFYYTVKRWKNADQSEKDSLKRQALLLLIPVLFLFIPLLYFVLAGIIRRFG
jgi:hypothetical protein